MFLAANHNFHRFRHAHTNVFSDPGIKDVGGADTERYASDCTRMWRMRVRADDKLPRQGVAFEYNGMADALRAFAICQFTMQPNTFALGKVPLLEF